MTFLSRFISLLSIWVFAFFGFITGLLLFNSIYLVAILPMSLILLHVLLTLKAARYYIVNINFKESGFTIEYFDRNMLKISELIQYSRGQIQFIDNAIGFSTLIGCRLKSNMNGYTIEQFTVGKWTQLELKVIESVYEQKVSELSKK